MPLEQLVADTRLDQALANRGSALPGALVTELGGLLAPAVDEARQHLRTLRLDRMSRIQEPLREGIVKLKRWKDQRLAGLEGRREKLTTKHGTLRSDQGKRLRDEAADTHRRYQRRHDWIDEGMRTAPEQYVRVAAVLIPHILD